MTDSETYSGEWEITSIEKVESIPEPYFHYIQMKDSWSFGIKGDYGIVPQVGDKIACRKVGTEVRGARINGRVVFNKSDEQAAEEHAEWVRENNAKQKAEFEANRLVLDARYEALPEVFRRRLDKFRRNNPDFRWQHEKYELFCCEQAVLIADALKSPQAIEDWYKLDFTKQAAMIPEFSKDHSGNTFGTAARLAQLYLSEEQENVVKMHGALAALVGSEAYGCVPRTGSKNAQEFSSI